MTDRDDFEEELRDGMRDATARVVAHPDLQRRLIAAARSGRPRGRSRRDYFRSGWAMPLSAAAVTALAVGSVVLISRDGDTSGIGTGSETSLPQPASQTSPTPAPRTSPVEPTSAAPTPSHTPKASGRIATRSSTAARQVPQPRRSAVTTSRRPSPTSSARSSNRPQRPAACSAPARGTSNPTTLAEFTKRVTATWLACSSPSVFGTPDAGLEITADGRWAKLVRDESGRLVPASGLHDSGTWKALDDSSMNGRPAFQLNLMNGNGTFILLADFAAAVNRVEFDNNGVYVVDYVPTSEKVATS